MGVLTTITQKISSFLSSCSPLDLVILGVIVLIPVLAVILAIASRASRKRGYDNLYVDRPKSRQRKRKKRKKSNGGDDYYLPREHRVRYIKTMAPKARKRVKVERVYGKADQATILATGIFGVGLGVMLHRAAQEERYRF